MNEDVLSRIKEAIKLSESGNITKAMEIYNSLLDYEIPEVYNNIGNLYRKEGMLGKSIEMYRKAIQLDSNFALPYFNLACALMELERYNEAILFFEKAQKLGLESFDLYVQLTLCYLAVGNVTKAKELMKNEEVKREVKKYVEGDISI
uniref:Tetratricopeptide repeat protein n=1 Tax=Fervidobacterium nodosum TaxID=2424 RepID=A0A7C5U770_9BACT